jgi:hypothetical protein
MNSTLLLKERILELEKKQEEGLSQIKQQASGIYESFKPVNIIKRSLESSLEIPEIKEKLIHSLLGLATGFITKKILVKKSDSNVGKVLGTVLQFVIAAIVAKNTDKIKEVSKSMLQYGLKMMEGQEDEAKVVEEKND